MKILVVDDVLVDRVNVSMIIKSMGHEVIEAENGKEAIEMIDKHMPDAVIMDIVMKVMDGFSALKRIKANPDFKHIPVIIVSSKSQESDIIRGENLGSSGWLCKPVNAADVRECLQAIA